MCLFIAQEDWSACLASSVLVVAPQKCCLTSRSNIKTGDFPKFLGDRLRIHCDLDIGIQKCHAYDLSELEDDLVKMQDGSIPPGRNLPPNNVELVVDQTNTSTARPSIDMGFMRPVHTADRPGDSASEVESEVEDRCRSRGKRLFRRDHIRPRRSERWHSLDQCDFCDFSRGPWDLSRKRDRKRPEIRCDILG